ncbi:TonB-dependent receptor [Fulvivirga sedimenti]|uniref:TonB-dependent receptor n=1 Tax=Fulvivirga sedimenti TaxID=2879465 RepID=A0A9X1L2E3_9BACT|nr:TonB-dependent receptor [Fulvivirga sedimenti]MCA6079202.1 TonB-dependent receptor [Fulvivirga sedimenti]
MKSFFLTLTFIVVIIFSAFSQDYVLSGTIKDKATGQPMAGVNIAIKDTYIGTISDKDGKFKLESSKLPPFVIRISMMGYSTLEMEITAQTSDLDITLEETYILGQEVVVSASLIEESYLQTPVSIEKLGISDLKRTTAANFYDGLYNLKGVDMNVQSLTFKTPNTRGFNGNTNYRFNQFVDGVDNTPAGLGFSAGNIFGLSQLDIESVELLVGASSALYGPGGMNGSLLMTSKNPFDYQGLSASMQVGVMHLGADYRDSPTPMTDFNLRYAKKINNKLAFKVVMSYLEATDWHAADYRDKNNLDDPRSTRQNNEGYDGVNVYGDDIIVPVNLSDVAPDVAAGLAESVAGLEPGTPEFDMYVDSVSALFPNQVISRTGWKEKDLVDYNTRNLRIQGSLNYRFSEKYELIVAGGYGNGTAVYTAQNRFSLSNFSTYMARMELKSPEGYIRLWTTGENAGDTYDAGTTGLLMNEEWKPSEQWYTDYIGGFAQAFIVLGFPLDAAYSFARGAADNRSPEGTVLNPSRPAFPLPGSNEFNQAFEKVTNQVIPDGTLVIDKTSMSNAEALYNFKNHIKAFELIVGGQFRHYRINTEGTTFFDEPGAPVNTWWWGTFAQIGKSAFKDRLKLTFSARYDKHQKFDGILTPRFSMVYALDEEQKHSIRASIQRAFRYPSVTDMFVDLNVGAFHVIGGLPEVHDKYGIRSNPVYPLTGSNPITDRPYVDDGPLELPVFRPEKMTAQELGYRGLFFQDVLLVDAYIFQNIYSGFHAAQLLAINPFTPEEKKYQTTVSSDSRITTFGWAIGGNLRLPKKFRINGNIAYNSITNDEVPPGFQTQFNTPDYRLNLGVGKDEIVRNLSANINWRWQNSFYWESTFGNGEIPAYNTLDVMVAYRMPKVKSILKLGASNVTNQYYTTGFGNAQIGGLYYVTWEFNEFFN